MLKVTLKNGNEYELLEDTTVYPSGSPNARSRMEIHMGEDAMTTAEFEAAFMDEAATAKIRLTKTTDEDNTKIVFDTVYQHYCLVASIGKKRVSKTDIATGQKCTLWPSWSSAPTSNSSLPRWGCKGGMAYGNF